MKESQENTEGQKEESPEKTTGVQSVESLYTETGRKHSNVTVAETKLVLFISTAATNI